MPIFWGSLAIVAAFIAIGEGWPAGTVSGGGLILMSAVAHSAGTAVAAVVSAPAGTRTPRRWLSAVAAAVLASAAWLSAAVLTYLTLTYLARAIFGSAVGVIVCLSFGYLVGELAANHLEPKWRHYARPLVLVVATVVLLAMAVRGTPLP